MIYLDHAATTPLHAKVLKEMHTVAASIYGNPSSVHTFGREAKLQLNEAKMTIAKSIDASPNEIVFTSGGTEANNLAIIGTALANRHKGKHIITTSQEHPSVMQAVQFLESEGFHVTYLQVNETGQVKSSQLKEALTDETILVSMMAVNNETGMIQPIEAYGNLLKGHQAYFHTDAVQAYELIELHVDKWHVDLLTTSAHKINGPKGIGFLYVKEGVHIQPLFYGGEQEQKRRPGTENIIAMIGFATAVKTMLENRQQYEARYSELKALFLQTLNEAQINYTLNGNVDGSVPSILNIHFPQVEANVLLTNLDLAGIAVSSGSACTAGTLLPSHVLQAMYGADDEKASQSIRLSFGLNNSKTCIVRAATEIAKIIKRLG